MDSINPLSSSSLVGSATSQGRGWGQTQQQLTTGQLVKAVVVEAREGGRFTLDIGGMRLPASSAAPLSPGQNLQLQVARTEPFIELKVVQEKFSAPLTGRSLALLGKNVDLSSLMQAIRQLNPAVLASLSPATRNILESFSSLQQNMPGGKDGGAVLKQLIGNLGLNLEHLLARGDKSGATQTVKAALLEIANTFNGADKITGIATKLITTLELFQFTQLHISTDTSYILPLPLPFIEQGYLLIERDGHSEGGKKDSQESRFSLHLTMSDLGNLRIDFLKTAEGLFLRFCAESKEKSEFLTEFGEDLKALLTDTPIIGLTFSGGAPDPINDLIRKIMPEGRSMLDMKV